jgi:hypothetical protein
VNFILSVFGSNLVIGFGIFVYLFMAVFLLKFWFEQDIKDIKMGGYTDSETWVVLVFAFIFWPIALFFYICFKILQIGTPAIFKFFDKITPNITFDKDK